MRSLCGKTWSVPYYCSLLLLIGNPYNDINAALSQLGFNANGLHHAQQSGHQSHFHVDLRASTRVLITDAHNLLADNTASPQATPVASDALIVHAQTLLDQVKVDLNLTQGEVNMFIPDMPNVPPQDAPVMIAQANQAQPNDVTTTRSLGVCQPAPSEQYSGDNTLSPIASAQTYFYSFEHQKSVTGPAIITILQQPKHGILRLVTEADRGTLFSSSSSPVDPADGLYAYLPEKGYGNDSATLLVDFGGGLKVKVVYFFQQHEGPLGNTG